MPQVPYQPFPQERSRDAPTPFIRLNVPADAFGENIGRAVSGLGAKLNQVGDELWNRAVAMQELKNETEVTNALSSMEEQSAKLRADYFNTQGNNAVNGYQGFIDSQNGIRDNIRSGLSNDMARKMFDRTALGVTNRAMIAAAGHSAQELRKANQQADASAVDVAAQNAGYSANDDEFNYNLKVIEDRTRAQGSDQGLDEGTIGDRIFRSQSKAYVNRIDQISRTDPARAQQMMEQAFRDQKIHTSDMDRIENRVNFALNNTGSRVIARRTLDEPNDLEAVYRGWFPNARVRGLNPNFANRFYTAARTYENETGQNLGVINSNRSAAVRTFEEQSEIYERSLREGFLAARPMSGRHVDVRGEALDVARGPFLDWLHSNAQRFGLEFLPGWRGESSSAFRRDPVHIQMARGSDGQAPSPYQIPERLFVDRARRQAESVAPNNAQFIDTTINRTMSDYRQQRSELYNQNLLNRQTIDNEILNNQPKTLEDLLSRSPDARAAYDNITDPRVKMNIERTIRQRNNIPSPEQIQNYNRLRSMSEDVTSIPEFAQTDLESEDLSVANRQRLRDKQIAINNKTYAADPRFAQTMRAVRPFIPLALQKQPNELHIFQGAMMEAVETWQRLPENKGKFPTNDELVQISRQILNPPATPGAVPPSKRLGRYEMPWDFRFPWSSDTENRSIFDRSQAIPSADEERIKEEFAKRNLFTPSDEDIRRAWIAEQLDMLRTKPK